MKLLVANWKMNLVSYKEAERLASSVLRFARKINNTEIVLCPPFPWLTDFSHKMKGVSWGAQDVFWEEKGAFTGEVSPLMLKSSGVEYVIIGHSERRKWLGETDEMINKKVLTALKAGLKVILCVGEPLAVRRRGISAAKKFVANQLSKDLRGIGNWKLSAGSQSSSGGKIGNLVVAYEPIWAVGTGVPDKPEDSAEMARYIKSNLKSQISNLKVLYGGSVTSKNAKSFLGQEDINGAFVGGASLNLKEFNKIVAIAFQL